ncbi:post-transcriptional regulator [Mesobacillus subterraneus]|uniref:Post-transcriptional regulator n=1 Tax=Mesobacillus subterraneus TaxID=285983 RepID=A0A3R9FTE7_9BACI|nr:post-transcriptional regulator [Mesobacillus subterraneus]RSD24086.1 post-transcriptional regulator [Mesobacillus subterraneus]
MERIHQYGRFYNEVKPALQSKVEEFKIFGYESVTEKELWDYLTKKKWKKPKDEIQLYEVVADILSAKIGDLMNFTTVEAFKLGDFSLGDEEERRELLK